jgi:hypothetical protein
MPPVAGAPGSVGGSGRDGRTREAVEEVYPGRFRGRESRAGAPNSVSRLRHNRNSAICEHSLASGSFPRNSLARAGHFSHVGHGIRLVEGEVPGALHKRTVEDAANGVV